MKMSHLNVIRILSILMMILKFDIEFCMCIISSCLVWSIKLCLFYTWCSRQNRSGSEYIKKGFVSINIEVASSSGERGWGVRRVFVS